MLDLTALLPVLAMLLIAGAIAGVLAGLLGIGGGIVLVPAFYYTFSTLGYNSPKLMQTCLATSLSTILVTSFLSVRSHNKNNAVDWGILKTWTPGIIVGSLLGMLTSNELRSETLLLIFASFSLIIGIYMAINKASWQLSDTMPSNLICRVLSSFMGFICVLMGIGGSSLGVPIMTLHGRPIHRAIATASGFGLIIALPSVAVFLFTPVPEFGRPPFNIGHINIAAFLIITSMTIITVPIGALLTHKLNPKPLKRIFAIFLIFIAVNFFRIAYL